MMKGYHTGMVILPGLLFVMRGMPLVFMANATHAAARAVSQSHFNNFVHYSFYFLLVYGIKFN